MKSTMKVALNIRKISVPEKINRARFIVSTMISNIGVFQNPIPALNTVIAAINALELAWNNAADGGKQKTAMMHEKEDDLMKLMNDIANYVERVADGNTEVVTAAGMSVKRKAVIVRPDFMVEQTEDRGVVLLRVKPRAKTVYRWEFCEDPHNENEWRVAHTTDVSTTFIEGVEVGRKFWYRVVLLNKFGESPLEPKCLMLA